MSEGEEIGEEDAEGFTSYDENEESDGEDGPSMRLDPLRQSPPLATGDIPSNESSLDRPNDMYGIPVQDWGKSKLLSI